MVAGVAGLVDLVADAVSTGLLVATADRRVVWVNLALADLVAPTLPTAAAVGAAEYRSAARVAVAEAGLPLADLGPGDPPRRLSWRSPHGTVLSLRVRCDRLAGTSDIFGMGDLVLYEIDDVTQAEVVAADTRVGQQRSSWFERIARTGTWDWDLTTGEVSWSPQLLELLGLPPDSTIDFDAFRAWIHTDDVGAVEETMRRALADPQPFTYTHRIQRADGTRELVFECNGDVFVDEAGQLARVMVTSHDVTELFEVQRELAYLAEHDPLTGLRNRRAMTVALAARFAEPGAASGALLLIDVDNFKDVNDLRGHAVGDTVLRAVTQLLSDHLRDAADAALGRDAVLGRLGGDEFAVILPTGDDADAYATAKAICVAVASRPVVVDGTALRTTVSIGVAALAGADGGDTALAQADLALYEAKHAGRDCARLFAPEQRAAAARRVSIERRVRDALDAGLMSADAQPFVDLETGQVVGYELLVRLRDGQQPELTPRGFLDVVERTDLVVALDQWMVERAVTALSTELARRTSLHLYVNVSARSLEDRSFGDFVLRALDVARVEPSRFGIEISESAAVTSLDALRRLADQLTAAGCRFTLDDFGAGTGSFVHLRTMPCTAVKIDGQVLAHADSRPEDAAIVDAIVRVARTLGIYTIAEGVDREQLGVSLRDLGIDFAQGFHMGRPLPLEELLVSLVPLTGPDGVGGSDVTPPGDRPVRVQTPDHAEPAGSYPLYTSAPYQSPPSHEAPSHGSPSHEARPYEAPSYEGSRFRADPPSSAGYGGGPGEALNLGDRHTYLDAATNPDHDTGGRHADASSDPDATYRDPDDPLGVASSLRSRVRGRSRGRHAAPPDYQSAGESEEARAHPDPGAHGDPGARGDSGSENYGGSHDYGLASVVDDPPDDATQSVAFNGFRR